MCNAGIFPILLFIKWNPVWAVRLWQRPWWRPWWWWSPLWCGLQCHLWCWVGVKLIGRWDLHPEQRTLPLQPGCTGRPFAPPPAWQPPVLPADPSRGFWRTNVPLFLRWWSPPSSPEGSFRRYKEKRPKSGTNWTSWRHPVPHTETMTSWR